MAFTFGFYNSLKGDRKYNAEQISAIFDGLIIDGVFHSQGDIFGTIPGSGMQVIVKSGRAWFNHTWNFNDSGYPLNLARADVTRSRYDAVVLEVNSEEEFRSNSLKILTGIPETEPVKPTMIKTASLNQYPLAYVLVPPNASSITASDIQVVVGTSECPFVTGLLESVNIDILFQKWEANFEEWFENLKAQLGDDIVANLQYQIDQRVKISDKATQAEATAGTNNTQYMTPLTTKQAIGTSGQTVLDTSTGKFVNIETVLDTVGVSPISISTLPGNRVNDSTYQAHSTCYNSALKKLFAVYVTTSLSDPAKYDYGVGYISTSSSGSKPLVSIGQVGGAFVTSSSYPIDNNTGFMMLDDAQVDGDVVCIRTLRSSSTQHYCLVDTKNNYISPWLDNTSGTNYVPRMWATSSYWGFFHSLSTTNHRFYYKNRANGGSFSSLAISTTTHSSRLPIVPLGAYSSNVWFLEKISNTQWQLGKIVAAATPTITRGVETYDLSSKGWGGTDMNLYPMFYSGSYAYVAVVGGNGICPKVMRISLSSGSSDWSTLPAPSADLYTLLPLVSNLNLGYVGTVNNKGYMAKTSNGGKGAYIFEIDKSSRAISAIQMTTPSSYGMYFATTCMSKRERLVNLSALPNCIPVGQWIVNVEDGTTLPIYVSASPRQTSVSKIYAMFGYYGMGEATSSSEISSYAPAQIGSQINDTNILGGGIAGSSFAGGDLKFRVYVRGS